MSASKLIVIVVILIILGTIVWLMLGSKNNNQNSSAPSVTIDRSIPAPTQPTPAPISKTAPVTLTTSRGIVQSVTQSTVVIKVASSTATLSISSTTDIQKLTSGTLEKGDAQTIPAKLADIAVGQEVLAVVNKGTSVVKSLLIIK